MTTTTTRPTAPPRDLVDPDLFARLARRIEHDENTDSRTAARIVGQALAFLAACAANPDDPLVPSDAVDAGWHAFILHTADYAAFCQRIAGRFIHHRPAEPGENTSPDAIGATIAAIRASGLDVDTALWVAPTQCSQCYQGCASDPRGV